MGERDESSIPPEAASEEELEDLELDEEELEVTERVRGGRRAISIP